MSLTVVILTKNEGRHIERAIDSVSSVADRLVVVDSGSTDDTVSLARVAGAKVLSHPFINQAEQFNWALSQLDTNTEWVLRLDADEILTPDLISALSSRLSQLPEDVHGISLRRRIFFLGRPIRWGGVFPVQVLRVFRYGRGRSEDRWMDEHIVVNGRVVDDFPGEIQDINQNSISWWISKHNEYASREAVELLNGELGFLFRSTSESRHSGHSLARRRWIKERVYLRLPGGMRALVYFFYRYVLRLGFLDGYEGTAFHVLQGFWYRYLVDVKLHEVRRHLALTNDDPATAVWKVLGVDVTKSRGEEEMGH